MRAIDRRESERLGGYELCDRPLSTKNSRALIKVSCVASTLIYLCFFFFEFCFYVNNAQSTFSKFLCEPRAAVAIVTRSNFLFFVWSFFFHKLFTKTLIVGIILDLVDQSTKTSKTKKKNDWRLTFVCCMHFVFTLISHSLLNVVDNVFFLLSLD